jgi:outer membrane protein OmpA-like peptidoglycan-associated protein
MKSKLIYYSIIILIVTSCATPGKLGSFKNKKTKSIERLDTDIDKSYFELYEPIFKEHGGQQRTTLFNKKEVQREKEFIAIIKGMPKPVDVNTVVKKIDSEADKAVVEAYKEFNKKLFQLEEKLSKLQPYEKGIEEEYQNLLIELNNLLCDYKEGLVLLEKKVKKLYGDVSFKTASFEITGKGKDNLKEIIENIESEVERWRKYTTQCNQNIFQNDLFVVIINIDGYADQRGKEQSNLILSQKRAIEVERLLKSELTSLVLNKKIKIVFDKVYSEGYGEKLPPGIQQGPEDDPNRRICIISYIVGPSRYLNVIK